MSLKQNFELMAAYNQWMNNNIYSRCETLAVEELLENRGAYFGSIVATLNHLLVADTFWFKRFANHPAGFKSLDYVVALAMPEGLDELTYVNLEELKAARELMDLAIFDFSIEANEEAYHTVLSYQNSRGQKFDKNFGYLVQHIFNHQTHHRGQLTTMLSQLGLDIGMTDMLVVIPDE